MKDIKQKADLLKKINHCSPLLRDSQKNLFVKGLVKEIKINDENLVAEIMKTPTSNSMKITRTNILY